MLTWLLINLTLGVLAFGFNALNAGAPHRLRFIVTFLALVAWLLPWPLLAQALPALLPVNGLGLELWRMERIVEAGGTRLTGVYPVLLVTTGLPLAPELAVVSVPELALLVLTLIGFLLFGRALVAQWRLLRRLARTGQDGMPLWSRAGLAPVCRIVIQHEIAGAFSSGLRQPCIWIHRSLVQSAQLRTLLQHELMHITQHDNWYLLAITLLERLFWWNPLVWLLGRHARELLELSCDERCQRQQQDYTTELAQLMLDSARGGTTPSMLALGANIFNTPHPNIKRLKLLQRSYPMLKRHMLAATVTAATACLAVGFVTAQPESGTFVTGERVILLAPDADGPQDVHFIGEGTGLPAAGSVQLRRIHAGVIGSADQMIRIDSQNGEARISLNFTDAPLPAVLMPLADLKNGPRLPDPGQRMIVRGFRTDDAVDLAVVQGEPASGTWAVPAFPLNDNLELEYPEAAARLVSVSGENLTFKEALALVASESGCNIFEDGEKIVVDWCEAQ